MRKYKLGAVIFERPEMTYIFRVFSASVAIVN